MILPFVKLVLSKCWYRPGSSHQILIGAMRGIKFHFTENSGFAALYSGNEKHNQAAYKSLVRAGDTVLDVGANWGLHTLYLARLVKSTGKVIAFEPHPTVFNELVANVALNQFQQVEAFNFALAKTSGEVKFGLGSTSKTSHIVNPLFPNVGTTICTKTYALDEWLKEHQITALRLMKIDVEGAESEVLQGAERTIRQFRPRLVVELHTPEQDLAVAKCLLDWNYNLQRIDGTVISNFSRSWPDPDGVWGTILATPV